METKTAVLSPLAGAETSAGRDVNYTGTGAGDWLIVILGFTGLAGIYMVFNEGRDLLRKRNGVPRHYHAIDGTKPC